mgnify:CR=1 FL=1
MQSLILSAGYGKRLLPLTSKTPKCLIKIKNKPMLGFWIKKLETIGIKKKYINTHYLSNRVSGYVNRYYKNHKIKILYEENLLGTAGTIIKNINYFKGQDLIIIHCDNYCLDNLIKLIQFHKSRPKECLMTMLTFKSQNFRNVGIIKHNNKNIITKFYEKKNIRYGNLANGGIYIISPELIEIINKKFFFAKDFTKDIIPKILGKIYMYQTKKYFVDIGFPNVVKKLND